jgi:hypothetical protein
MRHEIGIGWEIYRFRDTEGIPQRLRYHVLGARINYFPAIALLTGEKGKETRCQLSIHSKIHLFSVEPKVPNNRDMHYFLVREYKNRAASRNDDDLDSDFVIKRFLFKNQGTRTKYSLFIVLRLIKEFNRWRNSFWIWTIARDTFG